MDANEAIYGAQGSYNPLTYNKTRPTVGSGHDGSLATLIRTCGLIDPLTYQHSDSPPPSTYSRGGHRIDYILVSHHLLPAIVHTGIMPYDSVFISDHRPCYVDLDASIPFKDSTSTIEVASRRGLQLQDPRIVNLYYEHLTKQLAYHKLPGKIELLLQHAQSQPEDPTIPTRYEKIDKLITKSMLYAEKHSSKKYSVTYQWSPTLAKAVNAVRYWRLRIRQLKSFSVHEAAIHKAAEKAGITHSSDSYTTTDIVTNLREAHKTLKQLQQQHIALREQHLESLAAARVIATRPSLASDPDKLTKATDKEIRRLQKNERSRRSHKAIRCCLRPNEARNGLAKIDIPTDPNADPKTWRGAWTVITSPEDIATHVCKANAAQYHQAYDTPFAEEPMLSYICLDGTGVGAADILAGAPPPDKITRNLFPETTSILQTLVDMPAQVTLCKNQTNITQERFQALYKALPEKASSSPSGRHVGHYKVIASSDTLSSLWAAMMSIPHIAGFSSKRWQKVVDVMLEKSPGNSKIHRLWIIALQESDFNQSNRLAIGRPVMHHLKDTEYLPTMQHGSRPAKLCITAVLNKQLQFEIQRYQKKPLAYIENDATGCYDHCEPTSPSVPQKGRGARQHHKVTGKDMGTNGPSHKDHIWSLRNTI